MVWTGWDAREGTHSPEQAGVGTEGELVTGQ